MALAEIVIRSAEDLPGASCATCGQPMRVIPSTRKGQYFHRCGSCNVTVEATAPEP